MASALLTISGIIMSSHAPGVYGIFGSLNPVYYFGLSAILVSVSLQAFSAESSTFIAVSQIVLLEAYLWLLPTSWFSGMMFPASFHDLTFYPNTASIIATGHLSQNTYIYQSYPGAFIFTAILKTVAFPFSYIALYKLAPFGINLIVTIAMLAVFRSLERNIPLRFWIVGITLFELFNFTELFTTITPFTFGYVLLFFYFALFAHFERSSSALAYHKTVACSLVVMGALAISYPDTAIEGSFATIGIMLLARARHKLSLSQLLTIASLLAFIVIGWSLFGATSILVAFRGALEFSVNFLGSFFGGTVHSLSSSAPQYLLIQRVKLVVIGCLLAGALPGFVVGLKTRNSASIFLLFLLGGVALSVPIVSSSYGGNINVYLLGVAFPALLFYIMRTLKLFGPRKVRTVIILFFIASAPVSILVVYGQVASEGFTAPGISASEYYSKFLLEGPYYSLVGWSLGFFGPNLQTLNPHVNEIAFSQGWVIDSPTVFLPALPYYNPPKVSSVVLGSDTSLLSEVALGNSTFITTLTNNLNTEPLWIVVYSSHNIVIYQSAV